jgi:type II secretion system protein N
MSPILQRRSLKYVGYSAFFTFSFLFMLYLTFPYRSLVDWAEGEARKANISLSIEEIGPSWLWVKARTLSIVLPKQEGQSEPQPIPIDEVKIRPSLLPPGIVYEAHVFGGTVSGHLGLLSQHPGVIVHAKGLNLARSNSKAAVGLDIDGTLDTDIDLDLDSDGTKMSGTLGITGSGLVINGGSVGPYDLPKTDLGQLDLSINIENGKATVESGKIQGGDAEALLEGEIALAQKLLLSNLKLKLKFKLSDDFVKRNPLASGIGFSMTKDSKGFYTGSIARVLGNPSFVPQR